MVAFTQGSKRMDPTCVGKFSMPHMLMGSSPSNSERFFSVGNEKSVARFNPPWVKDQLLGYHLYENDKISFIVDLMNQNKQDKVVYMTLTYDYIEGHPNGIDSIKAIWLDVAQCGTSEILPPVQKGQFVSQYNWTANIEGEILGAGGVRQHRFHFSFGNNANETSSMSMMVALILPLKSTTSLCAILSPLMEHPAEKGCQECLPEQEQRLVQELPQVAWNQAATDMAAEKRPNILRRCQLASMTSWG